MTDKHIAFCLEYVKDFKQKAAAVRAGYSEKTADAAASRLLKDVKIQEEVKRLSDELLGAEKASLRYQILKGLKGKAFPEDQDPDDPVPHRDQIKSMELLGKYAGMFDERMELSGEVTVKTLTPEERRARIEALKNRID